MSYSPRTGKAGISEENDLRLRRVSGFLARSCLALSIILPAATAAMWVYGGPAWFLPKIGLADGAAPASWALVIAGLLSLLPVAFLAAGLLSARSCFVLFGVGEYLTVGSVRHLRSFGGWLSLSGVAGLALPTVLGLLLSAARPEGEMMLTVHLSSTPLLAVLIGTIIWTVADVMARAVAIAADHAQIV